IAGVVATGRVAGLFDRGAADAGGATRALLDVTPAETIPRSPQTAVALSPDGRTIVFRAIEHGRPQLYLRRLDEAQATPVAGTVGAVQPLFSPDGRSIAFFSGGELRRVAVSGGPPVMICKTPEAPFGASWGSDDRIVFARQAGGLWQVSARGGTPEELTALDRTRGEVSHRLPHVLPQGDAVLFTVT